MIAKLLDMLAAQVVSVRGDSMSPALPNGSWVMVNRRAFGENRFPARFDVVKLEDPEDRNHLIIKRVVGLPGEEVRLDEGRLFVDGAEISEPHLDGGSVLNGTHEWWLREDEYVVLGDNRNVSTDSRKFGPVKLSAFRGRAGKRLR